MYCIVRCIVGVFFFFFKQKTAYEMRISDWSSDVCSSDLSTNPGVGAGGGVLNQNVSAASQPNLRGLGADATLTLLNGHRLPYDSAFAGIDISDRKSVV